MKLGSKLEIILAAELAAGNTIDGEYIDQFGKCKLLVVLKFPFRSKFESVQSGVEQFVNRDSHYPEGRGYEDLERQEILLAPW